MYRRDYQFVMYKYVLKKINVAFNIGTLDEVYSKYFKLPMSFDSHANVRQQKTFFFYFKLDKRHRRYPRLILTILSLTA